MTTFRLTIIFSGIDFDDDHVFDALGKLSKISWRAQGPFAFCTAIADASTALKAADVVTQQVTKLVPSARPVRLDEDLVAIPDVAGRIGVTREAVRNWANGTRHANFPLPRGVVGDGIKVWAWADVNTWLRENLSLGDPEEFASAHDAALINALFAETARRHSVAVAAAATWSVTETVRGSAETRVSTQPHHRKTWTGTSHERVRFAVIDGGVRAAA